MKRNQKAVVILMLILVLVTGCNERDQRLLMSAQAGDLDTLNLLLEKDANVNVKDNKGKTPLMYAAQNGHLDVVKKLISSGAELNLKDIHKASALSLALESEQMKTVSYLVESGADIVSEINSRYYNLKKLGLKGFKFEITSTMFEQFKQMMNLELTYNQSAKEIIDNIKFYAVFKDEQFYVSNSEYSTTGNEQLDQQINQMIIGGINQSINGFYNTWQGFVIEPMFAEVDLDYYFEDYEDGYKIVVNEGGESFTVLFDKNLKMTRLITIVGGDIISIFPEFVDTKEGFLLSSYSGYFNDGNAKLNIDIEYTEIKGLKLPKGILASIEVMNERYVNNFEFINYEVSK